MAKKFDLDRYISAFNYATDLADQNDEAGWTRSIAVSLSTFGQFMMASELEDRKLENPVFSQEWFVKAPSKEFPADNEDEARKLAKRLVAEGFFDAEQLTINVREVARYTPEQTADSSVWMDGGSNA